MTCNISNKELCILIKRLKKYVYIVCAAKLSKLTLMCTYNVLMEWILVDWISMLVFMSHWRMLSCLWICWLLQSDFLLDDLCKHLDMQSPIIIISKSLYSWLTVHVTKSLLYVMSACEFENIYLLDCDKHQFGSQFQFASLSGIQRCMRGGSDKN